MRNLFNPPKTCSGSLVGVSGNSVAIVSYFANQAKAEGWTKEEINKVRKEALSSDYDHVIRTIMMHLDD